MTTAERPIRLWRVHRYPTWFASDASKELAAALLDFAVPLIALMVTGSPAQAGIIGAVGMVTGLVFTVGGGVLADRHRRTGLMLLGAGIGVALAAGFALLDAFSALSFVVLLVLNVLLNARDGIFDVAGEAALKEVVPDEAMGRAQAANQGRGAAIQLAGGPLGGALLAVGGWLVAIVAAASYLVSVVTALLLRRNEPRTVGGEQTTAQDAAPRSHALTEAREGFRWLFSRVDLRGVLWVSMIVNLGFNSAITTIIYSLQQAGHSPLVIGTLGSVLGAVMLAGAFIAPLLVPRVPGGLIVIIGLAVCTLGTIVLPTVNAVPGIMIVIGISVFLVPALNSALMGYFMVAVPTELLGRANSASRVLSMGAMPLAPLIAGFGLAFVGRTGTLIACAALTAIAVILAVSNRALRSLPAESRWSEHAHSFATPATAALAAEVSSAATPADAEDPDHARR